MEYATLNNYVNIPMAGIGTFLLTPDEAKNSCLRALQNGYRLIDTANAYCDGCPPTGGNTSFNPYRMQDQRSCAGTVKCLNSDGRNY